MNDLRDRSINRVTGSMSVLYIYILTTAMIKMFSKEFIEQWSLVIAASTIRLIFDYIARKKITFIWVILQYIVGSFCWYLAYKVLPYSDMRILYIVIAAMLSKDIMTIILSKEVLDSVKNIILKQIK